MNADTEVFDRKVRLHVYGRFVDTGQPPSVAEAAAALGAGIPHMEDAYRRLAATRVLVLHPGTTDVWMANPLSAVPTPFRVKVGGRQFFGNCVWDALGVVAMLGSEGRVETTCPDCGEQMTLRVQGGSLAPVDAVVHFGVPAARWWDDIGFT